MMSFFGEERSQGFRRFAVPALGQQDAQVLRIHLRFAFFSRGPQGARIRVIRTRRA